MSAALLGMQHSSLQFSDNARQQEQDIRDLFEKGRNWPIKTGTEAGKDKGPSQNRVLIMEYAEKHNHVVHFAGDNFVAVNRIIARRGIFDRGSVFVAKASETWGNGHDSVMATLSFEHANPLIGRCHVGAVHYPNRGQRPGSPNWEWNEEYAEKIGDWLRDVAQGKDLGFVNGDFNMLDNQPRQDWAFGGQFTSAADELKAWENTGHGPIDGFCSFDKDGRVSAHAFEVLNDKEFFQHSDHYVCRCVWKIRALGRD